MRSQRFILTLKWNPATSAAGARKAAGGFLRYIQYRDHHEKEERSRDVDGLLRYVAWRDRATATERLFNDKGAAHDRDRQALADFIGRSVKGIENRPAGRWPERACYRLILSPEDARGLDLRRLTGAAMEQLRQDVGTELPPWIAAEHRNTAHPHIHVVLAARREEEPGRFRSVLITRARLARMKEAVAREIERERGERYREHRHRANRLERLIRRPHARSSARQLAVELHLFHSSSLLSYSVARAAARMARRYQRELEREAERELMAR